MSLPSEPWIVLQETDLNDYLVAAQATAVKSAALAAGQADTWTNVMTDVVNELRSAIRGGCVKNVTPIVVSQTPLSVPPDLKRTALVMIRSALMTRLGKATTLTDDQKAEMSRAVKYVERIQEGLATVTTPPDPLTPDDQQRGTGATIVRGDCRRFTRHSMRGL